MLLANGASPRPAPGSLGNCPTLAVFIGMPSIFWILLHSAARVKAAPGLLNCPLVAAVKGNSTDLAKDVLELVSSDSDEDGAGVAQVAAMSTVCELSNSSMVRLLLARGVIRYLNDEAVDTPVRSNVDRLARSGFPPVWPRPHRISEEIIVHLSFF